VASPDLITKEHFWGSRSEPDLAIRGRSAGSRSASSGVSGKILPANKSWVCISSQAIRSRVPPAILGVGRARPWRPCASDTTDTRACPKVATITLRKYNWGFDPNECQGALAGTLKVVRSIGGRRVRGDSDDRTEHVTPKQRLTRAHRSRRLEKPLPPRSRLRLVERLQVGPGSVAGSSSLAAVAVVAAAQGDTSIPLYRGTTRARSDSTQKGAMIVLSGHHGHAPSPDERNEFASRPPHPESGEPPFGDRLGDAHEGVFSTRSEPLRVIYSDGGVITSEDLKRLLKEQLGPLRDLRFFSPREGANTVRWFAITDNGTMVGGQLVLHAGMRGDRVVSWAEIQTEPTPKQGKTLVATGPRARLREIANRAREIIRNVRERPTYGPEELVGGLWDWSMSRKRSKTTTGLRAEHAGPTLHLQGAL
jgi:hypothetical protein